MLDTASFFARPVVEVACDLIGVTLLVDGVGGTIVETEAYRFDDPASHSFNGPTQRSAIMFEAVGRAYVYRSYGLHWCLNFVAGSAGESGSAVLIRALEPLAGLNRMRERRKVERAAPLCSGPGRLCQALGVDGALNGHALGALPFELAQATTAGLRIAAGPRIGLTRAVDVPWRFCLMGSPFLSRKAGLQSTETGAP